MTAQTELVALLDSETPDLAQIRELINQPEVDVNTVGLQTGNTALMVAARLGNVDLVQDLQAKGAELTGDQRKTLNKWLQDLLHSDHDITSAAKMFALVEAGSDIKAIYKPNEKSSLDLMLELKTQDLNNESEENNANEDSTDDEDDVADDYDTDDYDDPAYVEEQAQRSPEEVRKDRLNDRLREYHNQLKQNLSKSTQELEQNLDRNDDEQLTDILSQLRTGLTVSMIQHLSGNMPPNVNAVGPRTGKTALIVAAEQSVGAGKRRAELLFVELFSTANRDTVIDVDKQDKQGWTALMYAIKVGNKNIARFLIRFGATLTDTQRQTLSQYFTQQVAQGHQKKQELADFFNKTNAEAELDVNVVRDLMERGDELHGKTVHEQLAIALDASFTPTGWLLKMDPSFEPIEDLINAGANINTLGIQTNRTALMIAIHLKDGLAIELCLKQPDVNVNETNAQGWTALMYAVVTGNQPVVKMLQDKGATLTDDQRQILSNYLTLLNNGYLKSNELINVMQAVGVELTDDQRRRLSYLLNPVMLLREQSPLCSVVVVNALRVVGVTPLTDTQRAILSNYLVLSIGNGQLDRGNVKVIEAIQKSAATLSDTQYHALSHYLMRTNRHAATSDVVSAMEKVEVSVTSTESQPVPVPPAVIANYQAKIRAIATLLANEIGELRKNNTGSNDQTNFDLIIAECLYQSSPQIYNQCIARLSLSENAKKQFSTTAHDKQINLFLILADSDPAKEALLRRLQNHRHTSFENITNKKGVKDIKIAALTYILFKIFENPPQTVDDYQTVFANAYKELAELNRHAANTGCRNDVITTASAGLFSHRVRDVIESIAPDHQQQPVLGNRLI